MKTIIVDFSPRNHSIAQQEAANREPTPSQHMNLNASDSFSEQTILEKTMNMTRIVSKESSSNNAYPAISYSLDDIRSKFPNVPEWMDKFLSSQPVATHNDTLNDRDSKFIVMVCHKYKGNLDEACGGLADRMMRLPYYVWLAHKTGRKLLMYWSTPFPLEEFFDVAFDDFDWRIPRGYFVEELEKYANRSWTEYKYERRRVWHNYIDQPLFTNQRIIFANTNLAKIPPEPEFLDGLPRHEVMGAIFHRLFKPSPKVMKLLKNLYDSTPGLKSQEYAAMHVRAKWPSGGIRTNKRDGDQSGGGLNMNDSNNRELVHQIADNAASCAYKVMPESKFIFVSSDSHEIPTYLIHESPIWSIAAGSNTTDGNFTRPKIIARLDYEEEPVHINYGGQKLEKYLGVFVDFWMMATSKCLAQGLGGFGHFGSELSGNHYSCRVRHRNYGFNYLPECPRPGAEMRAIKIKEQQEANENSTTG
jgi:hypothetical protein